MSAPHEWQATGGVEVKGKGTMDTFLFLPDSAAAAEPALPSNASAASSLQELQAMQNPSTFGPRISEQLFRLMEAFSSVSSNSHTASHTAGPPADSNITDDHGAGSGIGDRPSSSGEESPFSVVGEVISALRAAQQMQQQRNTVFGGPSLSPGPMSTSYSSAGQYCSATDQKSPFTKTTSASTSSHTAGTGAIDGGRGRVRSPERPFDVVITATAAASSSSGNVHLRSNSRGNVHHHSGGVGSGSLSSTLMEALCGTAAARRRMILAEVAATDGAAERRRGSNAGALTCFPTDLR